ncbi:hypothetical protein WJX74_000623 [Apatococcus lobatus]|uniref:Uncharacterized protein n=1 Tax=Apatococcus lobatus TaxID=904363 RepID=A0AAW1RIH1_9CHLO
MPGAQICAPRQAYVQERLRKHCPSKAAQSEGEKLESGPVAADVTGHQEFHLSIQKRRLPLLTLDREILFGYERLLSSSIPRDAQWKEMTRAWIQAFKGNDKVDLPSHDWYKYEKLL